jgi:hypothetical protein
MTQVQRAVARQMVLGILEGLATVLAILLVPLRLIRQLMVPELRSVWTGSPIITIAVNARAERMLGCDARSIVTQTYFLTQAFDHDLSSWARNPVARILLPYAVFIWASMFVDRLHFFCDRGLLPVTRAFHIRPVELLVYRVLGIQVFLWTYGADVRTRQATLDLGEPNCCTDCDRVGVACICDDVLQRHQFRKLARWTTAVFSMGDMTTYTPGSRNDLFFWPLDLDADSGRRYAPAYPDAERTRNLRIVHAPNHRVFKGTKYLESAIQELQDEGEPVELVLVEGVPNREAIEIYRSADIIFDQCLIGFHGYLALEAMALGKPVMCYIRERSWLLEPEQCPIVNVHATTLKEDIRRVIRERMNLAAMGRQGRRYIEAHFSVPAFSRRLESAYRKLNIDPVRRQSVWYR